MVRAALSSWATSPKLFRYIEQVSFETDKICYNKFEIRQSVVIDDLFDGPVMHEVEVEPIKNISTIGQFARGIQNVLLSR